MHWMFLEMKCEVKTGNIFNTCTMWKWCVRGAVLSLKLKIWIFCSEYLNHGIWYQRKFKYISRAIQNNHTEFINQI